MMSKEALIEVGLNAGLDVREGKHSDHPCLWAYTRPVEVGQLLLRIEAWRTLDEDYARREPDAISFQLQKYDLHSETWFSFSQDGPAREHLLTAWYEPVLRFLHHDTPDVLAEELERAGDWQTTPTDAMMLQIFNRRNDQLFGLPQAGDLCVSQFGEASSGEMIYVFQHIDPSPVGTFTSCMTIPLDGGRPGPVGHKISPLIFPYLRKLGPITLDFLPSGALNAHQRLKLLAFQSLIDTARRDGVLTHAFYTDLRRRNFGG